MNYCSNFVQNYYGFVDFFKTYNIYVFFDFLTVAFYDFFFVVYEVSLYCFEYIIDVVEQDVLNVYEYTDFSETFFAVDFTLNFIFSFVCLVCLLFYLTADFYNFVDFPIKTVIYLYSFTVLNCLLSIIFIPVFFHSYYVFLIRFFITCP